MRFRQIHLDFHTSGRIPGIGSAFDGKAFGKAFKDAGATIVAHRRKSASSSFGFCGNRW